MDLFHLDSHWFIYSLRWVVRLKLILLPTTIKLPSWNDNSNIVVEQGVMEKEEEEELKFYDRRYLRIMYRVKCMD